MNYSVAFNFPRIARDVVDLFEAARRIKIVEKMSLKRFERFNMRAHAKNMREICELHNRRWGNPRCNELRFVIFGTFSHANLRTKFGYLKEGARVSMNES